MMTLGFLVKKLEPNTRIYVKGYRSGNLITEDLARYLVDWDDIVVDWNFSRRHVIWVKDY